MYIANEPMVSSQDVHRYFHGCFVRDPHSGKPGRVVSIDLAQVQLHLWDEQYNITEVQYSDAKAMPFYSFDTYKIPELGWRQYRGRTVYLERNLISGGTRGLNASRIRRVYPSGIGYHDPLSYCGTISAEDIPRYIFNPPPKRTLVDAVRDARDGQHSLLSSKLALLRVESLPEAALVYQTSVVGVCTLGADAKLALAVPRIRKYLGECDGIEVTAV